MSIIGTLSRHLHFSEFNVPLQTSSGYLTPAQRKGIAVANLGMQAAAPIVQPTPATVNVTATMTAANLLTGLITSSTAAAVAATLPLATDLDTAFNAWKGSVGIATDGFEFVIVNTGPNAVTVTTNTGWTLVGNMVVAAAVSATFRVYKTAAGAWTIQKI